MKEDQEIFYPNKLTKEEVENLKGWKLKVATLHFGVSRGDCVRFDYGYLYRPEKFSDSRPDDVILEEDTIILVADRDGILRQPISLRNEIDWDCEGDLLKECGVEWYDIVKNRILEQIEILNEE